MKKLKPFRINNHKQVYEKRYVKHMSSSYQFVACRYKEGFSASYARYPMMGCLVSAIDTREFSTIEEARDWLFEQYIFIKETLSK